MTHSPQSERERSQGEAKHTPGLWRIFSGNPTCIEIMHGAMRVAKITYKRLGRGGAFIRTETDLANARLIAAAPELLEAPDPDTLDAIANEIDCFEHSARAASLRLIAKRERAAIAKAEGR